MQLKIAIASGVMVLGAAVSAQAAVVSDSLVGTHGQVSIDPASPCVSGAPVFRAHWFNEAGPSQNQSVFAGPWSASFRVTDAGGGKAYIANGDGPIGVSDGSGGTGFFDVRGNGSCPNAVLDLVTQPDGDAQVVGALPFVATGGTGALRGLTGSGTVTLNLELGSVGTGNIAQINFSGSLDVLDPVISVTKVAARYPNFVAFLQRKLTVTITLANDVAGGDSFDFQVTGATGGLTGTPTPKVARLLHGTSASVTLTLPNAVPGRTYNAVLTAATKDGLRATQFPAPGPFPVSITAPRTWGPTS